MSKRIRYKEHPTRENVVESVDTFTSEKTGARYRVRLDYNNNTYEIKNLRTERLIKGGENINNLNVLKRNAKAHLERLGVSFTTERRDRDFGLCEKGHTQQKHLEEVYERFGRKTRD